MHDAKDDAKTSGGRSGPSVTSRFLKGTLFGAALYPMILAFLEQ